MEGYQMFSADEKQLLKNMNLADMYFKANDRKEELQEEVEYKDKEIYSLKHDLIDAKIEKDKLLQEMEELKEQLLKEQKKQVRLAGAASARRLYKPQERL